MARKRRVRSAWAVCRAQESKSGEKWSKPKFERCVLKVKAKARKKK